MNILNNFLCPFSIFRGIIIFVVAAILMYPLQSFIIFARSRFEVFLVLAGGMDIISRTAILLTKLDEDKINGEEITVKLLLPKSVRALFFCNYGGQLLVPLWFCCVFIYFINRAF